MVCHSGLTRGDEVRIVVVVGLEELRFVIEERMERAGFGLS